MSRREELAATVIVGRDGWLFHRDHGAVEQVTGAKSFTSFEAERHRYLHEGRRALLGTWDAEYFVLVVPEKHVVYRDALDELTISHDRPARQLEYLLRLAGVPLLYPADLLREARGERETYFKTDTHWNMYGAFLGYRALCDALPTSVPAVSDDRLEYYEKDFVGDLGVRLDPERSAPSLYFNVRDPAARVVGRNHVFTRGSVIVFEHPDRTLPRAVVFRDSFANWLLPLLAESFSRVVAVSSLEVYFELVDSERPDVVIVQVAERCLNYPAHADGLGYFPHDLAAPYFPALCKVSVEDVRAMTTPDAIG